MGQNLKSWQKYFETLNQSQKEAASGYFIGAACSQLTNRQIGACLKTVKELINEFHPTTSLPRG